MKKEWNDITNPEEFKEAIGALSKSQLKAMGSYLGARIRVVFASEDQLDEKQELLKKLKKAAGKGRII